MFHILSLNDQTAANMITVHFLFYSGCFRLSEVTCSCSSCVQFRCLDQRWRSFITLCSSHTELPLSDLSCVECFVFGLSDFIKCDTQFLWKLLNPRFGPNSSSSSCSDSVDVISIKTEESRAHLSLHLTLLLSYDNQQLRGQRSPQLIVSVCDSVHLFFAVFTNKCPDVSNWRHSSGRAVEDRVDLNRHAQFACSDVVLMISMERNCLFRESA